MAGKAITNKIQLGDSATPEHNFVIQTNLDGTATLARGNDGATTQDILTINADGGVKSNTAPAFSAYANAIQAVTSGVVTKVTLGVEEYDTNSNYDTSLSRFTPTIAGYYQINAIVKLDCASSNSQMITYLVKNGNIHLIFERLSGTLGVSFFLSGSALVYMNGTTDYLELHGFMSATSPTFSGTTLANTSVFSGFLVRAA